MPLHRLLRAARSGDDSIASIDRILDVAREFVGMDVAFLSRWHDDLQEYEHFSGPMSSFGVRAGDALPLSGSFCIRVMDGRIKRYVPDTSLEPEVRDLEVTAAAGIGSYVGVPVRFADGEFFGMLCCASHAATDALGPRDVRFLEMIAQIIAERLDGDRAERQRRDAIELRIRATIAAADFAIHLQPIVRLVDRKVVGYEALARFGGPLARTPDVWFAEARSVGLDGELDLAVARRALRMVHVIAPDTYLSINVEPPTLSDPRFLKLAAPHARRVVVEVTEHAEVDDYASLAVAAASIRMAGMRLAVDDAGAGFASFRHIVQLAPDIIKADLSLTRGIDADPARRAVVRALVGFAAETGATLISEGVETAAECATLSLLGVGYGQGYWLGRPAPVDDAKILAAAALSKHRSTGAARRNPSRPPALVPPRAIHLVAADKLH